MPIKWLSSFNMLVFILLAALTLSFGPTGDVLNAALSGLQSYVMNFPSHSLGLGDYSDRQWGSSWTTFYWANWMAWAPITALFLGRISVGYTVRQFMWVNWILPSVFSIIWMSVFSGTVISQELAANELMPLLESSGPQAIIYKMIESFPMSSLIAGLFVLCMFISYVTAADSNTVAMAGLSSTGISANDPVPPVGIKILWGLTVGVIAWVMVSHAGIDGIKMLSNLGGLPSLCLLSACCIALSILLIRSWRSK